MATKPSKRRDDDDEDEDKDEEEEKPKAKKKDADEDEEEDKEEEEEDEDEDEEEDEDKKTEEEDEDDDAKDDEDDKDKDDEDADEDDEDGKDDEDEEEKPKSESSWKVVGEKAQKKLVEKTQALRTGFRREVWLADGDKKKFRFMTKEPLAMIVQHAIPRKIKGKLCFPKYTCTQSEDCQFCLKGLPASISAVYEVHNFERFTKKDGTEINVDTRFYVVPESRHQIIQKVLSACRPDPKEWLIEVERVGSGRKTTYVFLPLKKKSISDEERKIKSIADTFDEAYKPLPLKEQKLALSTATFENDDSDD